MKGRPGDYLTATLSNNLVEPAVRTAGEQHGLQRDSMLTPATVLCCQEPGDEAAWGYHNPSDTNLHTHGLHDETGERGGTAVAAALHACTGTLHAPSLATPHAVAPARRRG